MTLTFIDYINFGIMLGSFCFLLALFLDEIIKKKGDIFMIKQQKLSEKQANMIANLIINAIFKMNNDDLFTFYKKIKEELKRRGFDV